MPARSYRFDDGPVSFVAIDTNAVRWGVEQPQKTDVAQWLAEAKGPWRIVFGHHPYLSNGHHGNAGDYEPDSPKAFATQGPGVRKGTAVKEFLDQLVCGKADLYLSGHDHSLQWLEPTCAGTELAVSGGGAEATALGARNPVRFQKSALGFLHIAATATELRARFVGADGAVLFERTLRKAATP
jgi:hypothetical protein